MTQLEFWPDYDGFLWDVDGKAVTLDSLALSDDLVARARSWASSYDDEKLSIDDQGDEPSVGNVGDPKWLGEGADLFEVLRLALAPKYELVVTEPWWGTKPTAH